MSNLHKLSPLELSEKEKCYDSVYLTTDTYKVSTLASGCLLQVLTQINYFYYKIYCHNNETINQTKLFYSQVVDSVMNNESASGVAVIRPPGHHAELDIACGFCIFNSVAIAASYALNKYGLKRYVSTNVLHISHIIYLPLYLDV